MAKEARRVLIPEEKSELLKKHKACYICLTPLEGYSQDEIQYDHIYNYADGYPQDLSNFAPVHASDDPRKLNCHGDKGRKSPYEYREELRIKTKLSKISGLKDLCQKAVQSVYSLSSDNKTIDFNGCTIQLYNQKIDNIDNYYFFHEIETKYVENDDQIQLRPLEPKVLQLIFNLKHAVQLLPCVGRLDGQSRTVKISDGQHKAVAQIIGNNKARLPCIIFVHPDVDKLRLVIYQAHTDHVQQRYKKSHIDAKLAVIYKQRIDAFRKKVGDSNAKYSEASILRGESKAEVRKFLMASIISEIQLERNFIRNFAAQDRSEQKRRPMLWQSIEGMISQFCRLEAVDEYSDSEENYRSDEVENICFIIDQIEEYAIKNKWNPDNPDSKSHQLSRTYFYRTAFNNWISILEGTLRFALEQMAGVRIYGALCYRKLFSVEVKKRFIAIIRKLFEHPLWVQELIQNEIAKANQDSVVLDIFKHENLEYIYLTKL